MASAYADFVVAQVAPAKLVSPDLATELQKKREELKVSDEDHAQALGKANLTQAVLDDRVARGKALEQYKTMLVAALNAELKDGDGKLEEFRDANKLDEDDHDSALKQLGWEPDHFASLKAGKPRKLPQYQAFLRGMLSDPSIPFNLQAHERMVAFRLKYGITEAEHVRALEAVGTTPEEFHKTRMQRMNDALTAVQDITSGLDSEIGKTQQDIDSTQKEIENWKEKNKPHKEELAKAEGELKQKENELKPKREELSRLQVRVNVVKERIAQRQQAIADMEKAHGVAEGEVQQRAREGVSKQAEISKMKKEIATKREEIAHMKKALEEGKVPKPLLSESELAYLDFHRLCISIKISIQNQPASNVAVEHLWVEAQNLPRDKWRDFVRARLVPNSSQGYPLHRVESEKGLLAWLVSMVSPLE